jgi:predicted dehydrogenase
MSSAIRWGILGCGKIARKFAADIKWVPNASLQAVAARDLGQAQNFASEFHAAQAHGSYRALAENPAVDAIYIATPHSFHYEQARLCLEHGKAVLCEKAFTIQLRQAQELVSLARSRKIFLMEAFWTRFLPHYVRLKSLLSEGKVGAVQYLSAEFGFRPSPPISPRIYDPALGGGSLLDVGVYPVFLALDVLGRPDEIDAAMIAAPTGVDAQCAMRFHYRTGAIAHLFSSFTTNLASGADIAGDSGRLRLTHRFHGPTARLEFYPDVVDSRQVIETAAAKGFGYEYEIQHVTDCLLKGLTESPVRPHGDTLLLMETLDRIRAIIGLSYPEDGR